MVSTDARRCHQQSVYCIAPQQSPGIEDADDRIDHHMEMSDICYDNRMSVELLAYVGHVDGYAVVYSRRPQPQHPLDLKSRKQLNLLSRWNTGFSTFSAKTF